MTYISDESVQRVKDAVQIEELVGEYVTLKRTGKNLKACCPFHHEKTPSFFVTPERNSFKCFGCGEHGDGISFIMKMEHLDFPDAVRFLADKYGIPLEESRGDQQKTAYRKRLYEINEKTMLFYYKQLLTNRRPQQYLLRRGYRADIINDFMLGYAGGSGNELYSYLTEQGYSAEDLLALGLISRSNRGTGYYDRFRQRLMFPIINRQKKVIGFGGRVLDDSQPKYLNSPESEIFHKGENLYGIHRTRSPEFSDRVILVEGYMDVIALSYHGVEGAMASLGTSLTNLQARLIHKLGHKVYLSYDGDSAGIKAARRAIDIFAEEEVIPKLILLPGGEDPDEYCKSHGSEAYEDQLKEAVDPMTFELNLLLASYDLEDPNQTLDFTRQATLFLAERKQEAERDLGIRWVSRRLGVDFESLKADVLAEKERQEKKEEEKQARRDRYHGEHGESTAEDPRDDGFPYEEGEAEDVYWNQPEDFPTGSYRDSASLGKNTANRESERDRLEIEFLRFYMMEEEIQDLLKEEEDFVQSEQAQWVLQLIQQMREQKIPPETEWMKESPVADKVREVLDRLEERELAIKEMSFSQRKESARELMARIARYRARERKEVLREQLRQGNLSREEQGSILQELKQLDASFRRRKRGV